jgi:hypothetical protein
MRRSGTVALISFFVFASFASAQVTIQHGNTLSELINNLYGGDGIQLKDTGHSAHFGESNDFQNFSTTLQRVLQSHQLFPIPSAVGLVSYKFNEQTGTYERVQGSLGPLLADRGATTGKGTFTVSGTYSFSNFDQINGKDTIELVLHHCLTPDCTFGVTDAPFLHDTIHVVVRTRLKSQALVLSTVYGVTDRADVGLVIPYLRNDLQVMTNARIVLSPGSTPLTHQFDPAVETPGQYGTGTAIGIGDVVARGKVRILPKNSPIDAAVLADVSLPTGDKENFLGTGEVRTKLTFVASTVIRSLVPHINLGYEANWGESKLNAFDYRFGSEFAVRPNLTITGDILGVVRPSADKLFQTPALEGQTLIGRSDIDGALGAKYELSKNRAFLFNFLVPLNNSGVRASSAVTIGIQGTL